MYYRVKERQREESNRERKGKKEGEKRRDIPTETDRQTCTLSLGKQV